MTNRQIPACLQQAGGCPFLGTSGACPALDAGGKQKKYKTRI